MEATPAVKPSAAEADRERQQRLASQIEELVTKDSMMRGKGWRVESQSDFQAVLVQDRKVNHILHLVLSILTAGIWIIVWVFVVARSKDPKRKVLTV